MDNPDFASIWSRLVALIIDGLILLLPGALIHTGLPFVGPLFLSFLYYPVFHASRARATPGKRAMGLQVIDTEGQGLSFGMAILRHIIASLSSCMAFLPHLTALFTPKKQAVHDLIVDSIVVKTGDDSVKLVDAWLKTVRGLFDWKEGPRGL